MEPALAALSATLDDAYFDEALGYLITTSWELSRDYDPSFGWKFSTYSRSLLTLRLVSWYRATFGDTRYGAYLDLATGKRLTTASVDQATGEPCRRTRRCVLANHHDDGCVVRIPRRRDEVSLDRPQPLEDDQDEYETQPLPTDHLHTEAVDSDDLLLALSIGWK